MSLSLQRCRQTVREEGGSVFFDTIMTSGLESRKARSIAPQSWTWAAAFIYVACGCPFTLSAKWALERSALMICRNVPWKWLWTAFLENAINKLCSKISISPRDKIFTLLHKQNTQVSNKKNKFSISNNNNMQTEENKYCCQCTAWAHTICKLIEWYEVLLCN